MRGWLWIWAGKVSSSTNKTTSNGIQLIPVKVIGPDQIHPVLEQMKSPQMVDIDSSEDTSNSQNPTTPLTAPEKVKNEFHHLTNNPLTDLLLQPQWTKGEVKQRGTSGIDDYTQEVLPDGTNADRWYRKDGSLSKENMTFPSGEKAYRAFDENGKIKIVSQTLLDGTTIYTQLDSAGLITQSTIQKPDGSHYWTEYDDHGNPRQTYWAPANGIAILI